MLLRSALLEDSRNLRILLELVSGDAVSVNVNRSQEAWVDTGQQSIIGLRQ
jgi:hypothetical protein